MRVVLEGADRTAALKELQRQVGLNASTASALLNNFRCLASGTTFKAPMQAAGLQMFIDALVARRGAAALRNIVTATSGYVDYVESQSGGLSIGTREVLAQSIRGMQRDAALQQMSEAIGQSAPAVGDEEFPSEILREVWVRGPQHAAFRRELLRRWSGKCSVHGATCNDQLRASHIVAWSVDASIRGDVNNGLLLSVPLDSLFDRGLISFDDTGTLVASPKLSGETAQHFGVRPGLRLAWDRLSSEDRLALRVNLARHRQTHSLMGRAE